MRLAIIGGGVMGEAIIASLLRRGLTDRASLRVGEVLAQRRQHLEATYGVRALADNREALQGADIALLAVKPQEFPALARELRGCLKQGQTVLSIMAGVTIKALEEGLGHKALIRAMPNTPAQIGEGFTVWTATAQVAEEAKAEARSILQALGRELYVPEERYIDMATAVSASGPGFIFLLLEALIDGAVHIGLRREMAVPMVIQTVLGAARLLEQTGRHPAELKAMVTSPGGTTTEGLLALERRGVRAALIEAVEAAYAKAKLLGGQ